MNGFQPGGSDRFAVGEPESGGGMTTWTVGQLVDAAHGELVTGDPTTGGVKGICLDSRRMQPGEAFLAIRGTRYDGHAFLPEAIDRGASCLIVSKIPRPAPSTPAILVSDTVRALGAIAAYHRSRFKIPLIAVTGSCGKTTTKELIAHLLGGRHNVLKTNGTENNHIGLPLTLLRLSFAHEVAVVELGSNHPGEIAYLASIACPTVAVITNVGPTHLEFFGSLIEVLREKVSLIDALEPSGSAILPGDQLDVLLEAKARLSRQATLLTFGASCQCSLQALAIRRHSEGMSMRVRGVPGEFSTALVGYHNAENVLAALACVKALGISLESIQGTLGNFRPLPMRSELIRCNGITVVNDCYNSNPLSFARALNILKDLDVRRKVVIAGDMLELGSYSQPSHQAIGRMCAQIGIDVILAVGTFAGDVAKGTSELGHKKTIAYSTVPELLQGLPAILRHGDGVLIKGSRALGLEQVATLLRSRYGCRPSL